MPYGEASHAMKIKLIFLLCCLISFGYPNIQADENIHAASGRTLRTDGIVKVVGIGIPYIRRSKSVTTKRQPASAPGKVAISEINSDFRLGDVYVYPNPAKGGQIPTFHIEVGIADSIKITIYTVSGDVAHNYIITGQPIVINDGNGLEYAYEYAWRGHIPSGVYYFVLEAQKAGKKLKRSGKFAVVR